MTTKLQDWMCESCSHVFEYLTHGDSDKPGCPECGSLKTSITGTGGVITKLHDPEVFKETIRKRSADHSLKGMKKLAGHKGTLPKRLGKRGSRIGDD
jgi:hypothetical protein